MDTAERTTVEPPSGSATYDGFISYSHAADDLLAPRLQAGLQRFAKPWWKRRAVRIFRDESSLAANPHLWSSITEALDDSSWFVLLLSEDAASSEWVGKEIQHWTANKPSDRILPVVTDGTFGWENGDVTGTSVPPALQGVFTEEPRWVDLRFARGETDLDLQNPDFSAAVADIAATIRGVPKDELASEEVKQHRRTVRTAWAAGITVTLLAIAAIVAGVFAIGQRNDARDNEARAEQEAARANQEADRAETEADRANTNAEEATRNAQLAQARELAASAVNVLDQDPELAILLTLEAIEQTPEGVDQPVEVIDALWVAVQQDRLVSVIDTGSDGNVWVALSKDGSLLAASSDNDATLRLYSMPDEREQWSYTEETTDSFGIPFMSPDGKTVAVGVWDSTSRLGPGGRNPDERPARVVFLDATDGSVVETVEYPDCPGAMATGWSPAGSYFAITHFAGPCPREGVPVATWVEILDGTTFDPITLVDTIEGWSPTARFDDDENLYVFGLDRIGMEIYPAPAFEFDRVVEEIANFGDISPDGSLAVTYDTSGSGFGVYEVEGGRRLDLLTQVPGSPKAPVTPRFSDDAAYVLLATSAGDTAVWNLGTGERAFSLGGGPGTNAAFSPDGGSLYSGHSDGTVRIWNLGPGGGLRSADDLGSYQWINSNSFAIGPELGAAVAIDIPAFDFRQVFFDTTTGAFRGQPFRAFTEPAIALANNRFVVRTVEGEWIFYDPMTGAKSYLAGCQVDATGNVCSDTGEPAPELGFAVSVDGTELALSIDRSPFVLVDLDTGEELGPLAPDLVDLGFFTPEWVAGRTTDNAAVIVDRTTGNELHRTSVPQRGIAEVSADGNLLAVFSVDGLGLTTIDTEVWEDRTVQLDLGQVRGMSVSPDGTKIALGDETGLHVVDSSTGQLEQSIPVPGVSDIHWFSLESVLVGTKNGVWAEIPLNTGDLISLATTNLTRAFTDDECATYRIDPCPILNEIKAR